MALPNGLVPVPPNGTALLQMPVSLCTPIPDTDKLGARTVKMKVDWTLYGAPTKDQIAIAVDLTQIATVNPLDAIRSVYVDNTFSDVIIYVYFPDTDFTLVCPAGAIVWLPVITANRKVIVFTENFGSAPPTTVVHFCNFAVPGFYIPATQSGADANPVEIVPVALVALPNTASGNYVFAATPLGPPLADRLIVVVAHLIGNSPCAFTGMTMNGAAMTQDAIATSTPAAGIQETVVMAHIIIPTGVTGNIAVNCANAGSACAIEVISLSQYQSAIPISTDSDTALNNIAVSSVFVDVGGCALFGMAFFKNPPVAPNWSLDDTLTQFVANPLGATLTCSIAVLADAKFNAVQQAIVTCDLLIGASWR